MNKKIVVLAMHGIPPKDFPKEEKLEFIRLHTQIHQGGDSDKIKRHDEIELKMRNWPRNLQNDPFHHASFEIAHQISHQTHSEVVVGFNEFCAPDMTQALDEAASKQPEEIVVITPMMTPGGHHSEVEIPSFVEKAKKKFPGIKFTYSWPFPIGDVARFLADQVGRDDQ